MFSGIGGFELGIKQAMPDAECIGFSEIDKWAISIYQNHFKDHKNYGDANKINPSEIPDFDVLVGGFPCQAFSIAGNRKGFDATKASAGNHQRNASAKTTESTLLKGFLMP